MYAMLCTHPDLAYTIGILSQLSATPGKEHMHALDHVFCYLCATHNYALVFNGKSGDHSLLGYVDADWASTVADQKSISGYVFTLAGAAISWSSKKQDCIALSSTEAEYIAGTHASKHAIWLHLFFLELRLSNDLPTILKIDNQSAMAPTQNPTFHACTKHIDVHYHFL